MNIRVIFLCFVTAYGKSSDYSPYYKPIAGIESRDSRGQASNVKQGFVQPLDFSSFTEQFVGEEKGSQGVPFGHVKTSPVFGSESKKSGAFQIPSSEFTHFQGPIFPDTVNKTGFVQPVQFDSSFSKGENTKAYKTNINPSYKTTETSTNDQIPKATEGEDDDSYFKSSKPQSYRRPTKPKKPYTYGKSSYPSPHRKSNPTDYYSGLISNHKDVEMILPKHKVLFLPMVNGKPKPYDGYRAAPESSYETFENDEPKESRQQREKRLNEGEIIYGKPKIPLSELYHRHLKRSPAEYYGGIYPYYDYSDAKLSVGGDTDPDVESRGKKSAASNQKGKKAYPKKHRQGYTDKLYNPYKYPKDNRRDKDDDTLGYASGESSEETEEDSEESSEETKGDRPLYKYTYDDTVRVPPLEIKTYPYEKHLRDSEVEGSKRDESVEYDDNVDEYTAGYEKYIKTLPSDLETYFGSPEINEKFSVQATENLEKNKNCKKIENVPSKSEESSENRKNEGETAETQLCYICSDPETGDNYEQCAYRSKPHRQKYFFGGATSFQTNETAEPTTYRYKRSTYTYPYTYPYFLEQSESTESKEYREPEDSKESYAKTRKKYKKKSKKQKALESNLYRKKKPEKWREEHKEYNPFFKLQGAYSTKREREAKLEKPPKSYNGARYTYEGPEETYEGPSQPYEGPKETYEGPAEPYEGPINQEYYDTVDERIKDDEEEESPAKQESQSSSPSKSRYYNEYKRQKPKKRQSYSSRYGSPYTRSRYEDDDYEDGYRPHGGYSSNYRFGPEHFVDEGEPEETKQVKPAANPKGTEKRGPQKFSASEARSAAATDKQEKEETIGEVKTFKNGDVCQKKRKEGMICMVCKNEKTAATYEQCQYSTKPKDKYYAFGSQKSYTTKNPNSEQKEDESESESESDSDFDQFPEKSDIVEKKILITTQSKVFGYDPNPTEGLAVAESNNSPRILSKDLYGDYTDNIETLSDDNQNDTNSRDFRESIERIEPRDGIEGLEEYLYDVEDSEKKATEDEKQSYKTYDDYFHDLFPEFGKSSEPVPESDEKEESESESQLAFDPFSNVRRFHEENTRPEKYSREEEEEDEEEKDAEASRPEELRLKDRESRIPRDFFIPYNEEEHKKDLEKALGEFQNRDWSNCTKIVKKKLTCYQCVDKNGVNNEECMYVEASQPISKHLAYHEKKELKPASQEIQNKTIEQTTEITQPEKSEKTLRRFRKDKNSPAELIEVAEPPKDAEYLEETTTKGDFEGVEKLPAANAQVKEDATEVSSEHNPTPKQKPKKNKRKSKKRNKTIRNETTTERFEKIRKRKFPLKKFTENEQAESKPGNDSFGLRSSELPLEAKQNKTETSR